VEARRLPVPRTLGDGAELDPYLELAGEAPEELVRRVYRLVLRRDPDPDALARSAGKLREGTLSPATLLAELAASDEFGRVQALDDAVAFAAWARAADERPRGLGGPAPSDERVVEIPWTLARLRGERRVLDVGYAFAEPAYLAGLAAAVPDGLVGVDLIERDVAGLRPVVADVRALPFASRSFDAALCISTLEHVGLDNRVYGGPRERDESGPVTALRELRRVLARRGRLLVTVPTGRPEEQPTQVVHDPAAWLALFRSGGFLVHEHEVYERTPAGWRAAGDDGDVGHLSYGERGHGAAAVLCAELHPARAAARVRHGVRELRGRGPDRQV
jgi:SAM-dependent methyltransferase